MLRRTAVAHTRVAVLGASGAIGQTLSFLLKRDKLVSDLRLYDLVNAPGVAADLAHVASTVKVSGHSREHLQRALDGAEVVIMPAGIVRRPGMVCDDLFFTNARIVEQLTMAIAAFAPRAIVGVVSDPLNSMTATVVNILSHCGVYDPRKVFGVTAIDQMRARTFLCEMCHVDPETVKVTVLGGHGGQTMIPLFAHCGVEVSDLMVEFLSQRLRKAGDDVVKAKAGAGASSLASAYAVYGWASDVLRGLNGEKNVTTCALIDNPLFESQCRLFTSPARLGPEGVEEVLPLPELTAFEMRQLDRCLPDLEKNLRKGFMYGSSNRKYAMVDVVI